MNYQPRTSPDDAPIIQLVSQVLLKAHQHRASDIHWEPLQSGLRVRFRIDGVLQEVQHFPKNLQSAIVSRLKIMTASMNIAEKRLPQDGRFQMTLDHCTIDLRVSTIPTLYGESIVMRLLERSSLLMGLAELGLQEDHHRLVKKLLHRTDGLILVTGPTGSGKSTTLYSCLQQVHASGSKLLTAEDPIEYEMDGIMQVPINNEIGLGFASVLRSFLRQDPDVIMIGETRDVETAQMAMQASLTGHLVLTTLHTNDAAGAISRLIDMGIEPLIIAATLEAVLAQRLVRKICTQCRVPYQPEEVFLQAIDSEEEKKTFYRGQGCDVCHQTGYRGRMGLFELLIISDLLRTLIHERASHAVIREKARELGMKTLREHGLQAALEGITTLEEVLKWT
ncbi:MAG: GspE/PulE family protein [Chthoniobacterales bacterium]